MQYRLGVSAVSAFVLAASLVACGGGGDISDEPTVVQGGIVMGVVTDLSGTPIEGVALTLADRDTASNGQGWFTVAGVPAGERVVVRATLDGYVGSVETVAVVDGATSWVDVHLAPVEVTATVDPAAGGAVASDTQTVTFPPNAFVDATTGAPITEPVEVALSAFDFGSETDIEAFPGDFVGRDASGAERALESLGFLEVSLSTASGARVDIADGVLVELRLDSAVTATAPATVPLWYFDEAAGLWVEDGEAVREGTALVGSVTHFTWWNFDLAYDVSYLTGRVVDSAGSTLSNAHVEHRGLDYRGGSARHTDSAGVFTLPVNPDSRVSIWAVYRGERSVPMEITTAPAGETLDIGDIVIPGIGSAVNATFMLSWGAEPNDLDAHLWTPSGEHVYYGARGSLSEAPFAQLNTDDTSFYGPEITTITALTPGTYVYCVNNFSEQPGFEQSNAVVTYSDSRGVIQQIGAPRTNSSGNTWWRIATFESEGGRIANLQFDGSLVSSCP